jgi:hypothetical protein
MYPTVPYSSTPTPLSFIPSRIIFCSLFYVSCFLLYSCHYSLYSPARGLLFLQRITSIALVWSVFYSGIFGSQFCFIYAQDSCHISWRNKCDSRLCVLHPARISRPVPGGWDDGMPGVVGVVELVGSGGGGRRIKSTIPPSDPRRIPVKKCPSDAPFEPNHLHNPARRVNRTKCREIRPKYTASYSYIVVLYYTSHYS